jgi:DNA-directed RNA polymerase subunit K/omega
VADRNPIPNAFEFVVVAGARARQLLRGCTPRTSGSDKPVRLAQKEVKEGKVERVPIADGGVQNAG